MPGFDAGDIQARLVLDRSAFQAGLDRAKADAEDFESGEYQARLGVDDTDARAKLDEARADADRWDATDARARLGVDDTEAQAGFDELFADADRFDAEDPTAHARLDDTDAKAKLDELQARIDELQSTAAIKRVDLNDSKAKQKLSDIKTALADLGNETLNPGQTDARLEEISGELDKLDGKINQVGDDSEKAGAKAGQAGQAASGLMAAATALGPAVGTAGAVAAAGLIGILPAIATVGVGFAGFALAAQGDMTMVRTQVDQVLHSFQQANSAAVLPALSGGIGLLSDTLKVFSPLVDATAGSLSRLEISAQNALGSPYWEQFFHFLPGEATTAFATFGHVFGGLGVLFSGLTEALSPLTRDVEQGLDQMANHMIAFGKSATANGGIQSFINFVNNNSALADQTLKAIGHDLLLLAENGAHLGPPMLRVIDVMARLLGDVEQVSPGLVELAGLAYTVNRAWAMIPFTLKDVGNGLKDLGAFKDIANGAATAAGPIGKLAASMGGLSGTTAKVGEAATTMGADMEAGAATAEIGWFGLLGPIGLVAGAIAALAVPLTIMAGHVHKVQQETQTAAQTWAASFVQSAQATGISNQALENLIETEIHHLALQTYMSDSSQSLNDRIHALNTELGNLKSQYAGAAAGAQAAGSSTTQLATFISQLGSQSSSTSTDLSNLNSALQIMVGNNLNAQSAVLNSKAAIDSLSTSLKTSKGRIDDSNAASIAAHQAAVSWAQSLFSTVIPALAQNGVSSSDATKQVNGLVTSFDAALRQGGLTTSQINALNQQLGLTPGQIAPATKALYNASGAASSSAQAAEGLAHALQDAGSAASVAESQLSAMAHTYVATLQLNVQGSAAAYQTTIKGLQIANGYAAGTASAPGGPAVVGEKGPELMVHAGHASLVGAGGPEVRHVPRGAAIYPADVTAKALGRGSVPAYAEGTAGASMDGLLGSFSPQITVTLPSASAGPSLTYSPRYDLTLGAGSTTDQASALKAVLAQHDAQLVQTLSAWLGTT